LQHEEESEESDEEGTKKKKRENVRRASRAEKHQALELHRSHLLTLLAHALHCSALADDQILQASVLSLFEHSDISVEHDSEKEFLQCLHHLADWFVSTFTVTQGSTAEAIDLTAEVGFCCVHFNSSPITECQASTWQEKGYERQQVAGPDRQLSRA